MGETHGQLSAANFQSQYLQVLLFKIIPQIWHWMLIRVTLLRFKVPYDITKKLYSSTVKTQGDVDSLYGRNLSSTSVQVAACTKQTYIQLFLQTARSASTVWTDFFIFFLTGNPPRYTIYIYYIHIWKINLRESDSYRVAFCVSSRRVRYTDIRIKYFRLFREIITAVRHQRDEITSFACTVKRKLAKDADTRAITIDKR